MKQLFLLAGICSFLFSQAQVTVKAERNPAWKKIYRAAAPMINDLVHTKLDVKFDFNKAWVYGKEWITLKPHFYPTDSLTLDAKGITFNEVSLVSSGKKIPLKYTYTDSLNLYITLDRTYKSNESYTIFLDYISKPNELKTKGSDAIKAAKGLYFINPTGINKDKPTQIWTQGETESNSVWMPTIDKPNQKSTEEISITVPSKYVTLSNGMLISQKTNSDGTRTDNWKLDLPNAPYLFFMGVGEYDIIKDSYKGKEVSYYVEKEYAPVAKKIFGLTPEMIKFFSEKLGMEYQWPKYAQIVGRDYVSGAMENTTATLHQESAYQNARQLLDENSWEEVIAHELFHQWFGDLVTCESWSNLTVNESFADFSETLWDEYKHGKDFGDAYNYKAMDDYLESGSEKKELVRYYYRDREDMFDVVSYYKGGRILNMLRNYVGEDAFFKSLNNYLTTNKFKTGEAQQLRIAFEQVTGQDLNWFFNQWYYSSGHPVVKINYSYDDAAGKVMVIIQQRQESNKPFRLPVAIDVYNGPSKKRYHVWMNNMTDTFSIPYTQRPDLVNVDGDKILLWDKLDEKTADNFRAQIKYAPLYVDRREAIDYFAKNKMTEIALGLKDKFAGLREYTLATMERDTGLANDSSILQTVEQIAKTDSSNKVRAQAIEFLAYTTNPKYKPLFEQYVTDSSYSIAGSALEGLNLLEPENALANARKFLADARGKLGIVVARVIMRNGKDADYDFVTKQYTSVTEAIPKLQATIAYCEYLTNINDTVNLKKGIDKVVDFKNHIAEYDRIVTDPIIKASLDKLGKTKGSEISAYINDALK